MRQICFRFGSLGLLFGVSLLVAAACSGDDAGTGDSGAGSAGDIDGTRAQLRPLVVAQCEWLFGCCDSGELAVSLQPSFADAEDCADRMVDALERRTFFPHLHSTGFDLGVLPLLSYLGYGLDSSRTEVDQAALDTCVQAVSTRGCQPKPESAGDYCEPQLPLPELPCDARDILIGSQKQGEACGRSEECAKDLVCIGFSASDGVCVAMAAEGEVCFDDRDCAEGLLCDFDTSTCMPGAGYGEPCAFADPENPENGTETTRCSFGLSCDATRLVCTDPACVTRMGCEEDADCPQGIACLQNRCQEPLAVGKDCYQHQACASGYCDGHSNRCAQQGVEGTPCTSSEACKGRCDFSTSKCVAYIADGMPCSDTTECAGFCDPVTTPGSQVCASSVGEGEPCPNLVECGAGLQCLEGTCTLYPYPDGTACFNNNDCESELCFENQCTSGTAIGEACTLDGSLPICVKGAFCDALLASGTPEGTCQAQLPAGATCTTDTECVGRCGARFGELRCIDGVAAGEAFCDGE